MKGVWGQINKMKKTNKIYEKWTDHLICKIYKCNKEGEPITKDSDEYTAGNLPPLSRIDKLEKRKYKYKKLKDKLEIRIKSLEDRLEELEKEHKAHTHDVPGVQQNETRSEENRARIRDLESWRQRLGDGFVPPVEEGDDGPGAGGGKRRKRTRGKLRAKSRAKSRKKRRRKRRKKKTKKRRKKRTRKRSKRKR